MRDPPAHERNQRVIPGGCANIAHARAQRKRLAHARDSQVMCEPSVAKQQRVQARNIYRLLPSKRLVQFLGLYNYFVDILAECDMLYTAKQHYFFGGFTMSNCMQCHNSLSASDAHWPCCSDCCPIQHLAVGPTYCAANCSLYDADSVKNAQTVRHYHKATQTQDQTVANICAANKRAVKRGRERISHAILKLHRPYPVQPVIYGACIWMAGRFCGTFYV